MTTPTVLGRSRSAGSVRTEHTVKICADGEQQSKSPLIGGEPKQNSGFTQPENICFIKQLLE